MKKVLIIIVLALFCVTGCGKFTKDDALKKLEKQISSKSYIMKGTMQIISNEEKFDYNLTVNALNKEFYKVGLVNQTNNHEQIILKNKEGVYVITPALNKSFKFQSEWPSNSSQAYILESILKDLKDDSNMKFEETENGYILKSIVNYPNNTELSYQKVTCNKNMEIKQIQIYDINDIVKISVVVNSLDYKTNLSKNDFLLEDLIEEKTENSSSDEKSISEHKECENKKCEDNNCEKDTCEDNPSSNIIDEIIYPLYVPNNTYLSSSEKIDLDDGNRVILTFSGEKDFVLVEEISRVANEFEIIPIYGDPQVMSSSVAAVGANSIYFSSDNIDYYIASEEMSSEEMLKVASSLGNSILVSESK